MAQSWAPGTPGTDLPIDMLDFDRALALLAAHPQRSHFVPRYVIAGYVAPSGSCPSHFWSGRPSK